MLVKNNKNYFMNKYVIKLNSYLWSYESKIVKI